MTPPHMTPERWKWVCAAAAAMDRTANRGASTKPPTGLLAPPVTCPDDAPIGHPFDYDGGTYTSDPGAASTARGPARTKGPSRHA